MERRGRNGCGIAWRWLTCTLLLALWMATVVGGAAAATNTTSTGSTCVRPSKLGLVIVIDDSGSNAWTDPTGLRGEAAAVAIDQLSAGSMVATSVFSTGARRLTPPTSVTTTSRGPLKDKVRTSLLSSGGTNYQAAFIEAANQLAAFPADVDQRAVLFLSDGDPTAPYSADSYIAAAKIPIHTIGFGGADMSELAGISARSGGQHWTATDAASLQRGFAALTARAECYGTPVSTSTDVAPTGGGAGARVDTFGVSGCVDEIRFLATWDGGDLDVSFRRPDYSTADLPRLDERLSRGPRYALWTISRPAPGTYYVIARGLTSASVHYTLDVWQRPCPPTATDPAPTTTPPVPTDPAPAPNPGPEPAPDVPPVPEPDPVVPEPTPPAETPPPTPVEPEPVPPVVEPAPTEPTPTEPAPVEPEPTPQTPEPEPPAVEPEPPAVEPVAETPPSPVTPEPVEPQPTTPAEREPEPATPPPFPAPARCEAKLFTHPRERVVRFTWSKVRDARLARYEVQRGREGARRPGGTAHTRVARKLYRRQSADGSWWYRVRAVAEDGTRSEWCSVDVKIRQWPRGRLITIPDSMTGSIGPDRIDGRNGNDRVVGRGGDDQLIGGPGTDLLAGGTGDDLLDARDGAPNDVVSCGPGNDRVLADRGDLLARDCEHVTIARR